MNQNRKNISTGAKWEDIVGYSRAVKIGNQIEVSGTVALDDKGNTVGMNNAYLQTKRILEIIQKTLKQAGASMDDVVRTRIYVTDISLWEEVGKAHGEIFGKIKPATSMVEVSRLISDDYLVEIEAIAVIV